MRKWVTQVITVFLLLHSGLYRSVGSRFQNYLCNLSEQLKSAPTPKKIQIGDVLSFVYYARYIHAGCFSVDPISAFELLSLENVTVTKRVRLI